MTLLDRPLAGPDWRRDGIDLVRDQLAGIDALHALRRDVAAVPATTAREDQLDHRRRQDVAGRMHAAVADRAMQHLESGNDLGDRVRPLAVIGHCRPWFVDRVVSVLAEAGVDSALLRNAADLVGTAAVEQPDLVLLEDRLPMMRCEDVVAAVRRVAPTAVIGVQLGDVASANGVQAAGAQHTFARQVPPADVCAALLSGLSRPAVPGP